MIVRLQVRNFEDSTWFVYNFLESRVSRLNGERYGRVWTVRMLRASTCNALVTVRKTMTIDAFSVYRRLKK